MSRSAFFLPVMVCDLNAQWPRDRIPELTNFSILAHPPDHHTAPADSGGPLAADRFTRSAASYRCRYVVQDCKQVTKNDNPIYRNIISVYTGTDEAGIALTDDGIEALRDMLTDARRTTWTSYAFIDASVDDTGYNRPPIIADLGSSRHFGRSMVKAGLRIYRRLLAKRDVSRPRPLAESLPQSHSGPNQRR